jgi:hypothetical protein
MPFLISVLVFAPTEWPFPALTAVATRLQGTVHRREDDEIDRDRCIPEIPRAMFKIKNVDINFNVVELTTTKLVFTRLPMRDVDFRSCESLGRPRR